MAVVLAGTSANASGIGHPYWAVVAAVVPLGAHTYAAQLSRGVHRVAGTGIGLLLAAGLLALPLPPLAIVLVVAALQAVTELLVVRLYAAALVAVTPLALLLGRLGNPEPASALLRDRAVETAVGVVVGLSLVVLTRERVGAAPGAG